MNKKSKTTNCVSGVLLHDAHLQERLLVEQAGRATPKGSLRMPCAGEPKKAKQLLSVVSKPWNTVKFDTEYELVIYVFQGL